MNLLDQGISFDDENKQVANYSVNYITSETRNKSYILTVSERTTLTDGFRYIKEYLMQYHNMLVNDSYNKLTKYGVDVFTFQTNAFVLRDSDLEQAYGLIKFDGGFGTWRISMDSDIILPSDSLRQDKNTKLKLSLRL